MPSAGTAVAQDVGNLFGNQVPVDRHECVARIRARIRCHEPLDTITCDEGNPITLHKAAVPHAVDELIHPQIELGPAQLAFVVDYGNVGSAVSGELFGEYGHGSLQFGVGQLAV